METKEQQFSDPETKIEDPEKAETEAYLVKKIAGSEIDRQFNKLKVAQALGLEKQVGERGVAIQKILEETDSKVTDKAWENILTGLYERLGNFFDTPIGFKEYIETKFGELRYIGDYQVKPSGHHVVIPNTDYVFTFGQHQVRLQEWRQMAKVLRGEAEEDSLK